MQTHQQAVAEFHAQIGASVSHDARLLPGPSTAAAEAARHLRSALDEIASIERYKSEFMLRFEIAVEELCEWAEAHAAADLVAAADAWGDRCYVLLGDAVAAGLPAEDVFWEVHRSNMTKGCAKQAHGKGTKSSGFDKPRLEPLLVPRRTR